MAQFHLSQLLLVTAGVCVSIALAIGASEPLCIAVASALVLSLVASIGVAIRGGSEARVACFGFVVCCTGYLASSVLRVAPPPQIYLCATPFGTPGEVPAMAVILHLVLSAWIGVAGGVFARYCQDVNRGKKVPIRLPFRHWLVGITAYILLTLLLVHFSSPLVASLSKTGVTSALWIAAVGTALRRGRGRTFWGTCAIVISLYLFLEMEAAWPMSYFLGPAPYLYAYYNSVSTSWVTAHCLTAPLLAVVSAKLYTKALKAFDSCSTEPSDATETSEDEPDFHYSPMVRIGSAPHDFVHSVARDLMEIKLLNSTNRSLLDRVAPDVFDNAIDASCLDEFIACPRHALAMAVDDGRVVGMASGFEYFHPDKKRQFFINEVGVAPSHRNQGVGRRLVACLLDHARHRGCYSAWLGTEKANIPGIRCFSSVPNVQPAQDFVLYEWALETL